MDGDPDVLVLGPGGVKGYQQLGYLYGLDLRKKIDNIHTFIGVSVGAMICLLKIVGYTYKEIINFAIENVNFISTEDLDVFGILKNLKDNFGLFPTTKISDPIEKAVKRKLGYIPTLRQLYEYSGKELIIVTFNLGREKPEYLSHINNPDMNCVKATVLSALVPIVFFKTEFDNSVYIDGAFGDPYPVLIKDDGINRILGIYIETNPGDRNYKNFLIYLHDIFHCSFHLMIRRNIKESSSKCYHVALKNHIMDTMGTTVSMGDKARMILNGIEESQHFG